MYLTSCTRVDIAYTVSKLSRYISNLGVEHWKGIVRVLKCLRYTCNYELHYTRYPAVIEGYWLADPQYYLLTLCSQER